MANNIDYVLGLDLGETSMGWSVIRQENGESVKLERMGVRIFSDGRNSKNKEPLSVARRIARGSRRRHDRYIHRRTRLMDKLIQYGLMPADESERKELEKLYPYPYLLRAKALDEKLPPYELGRALFHINQRRGFKSNRKTDKNDKESGAMKTAIAELQAKMQEKGARTLGEYLYSLNKDKKSTQEYVPVRMRSRIEKGKAAYEMYPDRAMYEDEVHQIFAKQELSKEVQEDLFDTIFYQRPLKPQELGFCQFEENERRAYMAYPAFQKYRALQQVNQLYVQDDFSERPLTQEERETLYPYLLSDFSKLNKAYQLSWAEAKKLIGLGKKMKFNLESERRKGLDADIVSAKLSVPECFGKEWAAFEAAKQNEIVNLLLGVEQQEALQKILMKEYGMDNEHAVFTANISLPDKVGSLSLKAIEKLIPYLEQGELYDKAVVSAGYVFSRTVKDRLPEKYTCFIHPDTGEEYDELPYYGEVLAKNVIGGSLAAQDKEYPEKYFGKINNPTVHIVLNQVRRLVNELVKEYGHPSSIVVELARDLKLSQKRKKEIEKEQSQDQKENERINAELVRLGVKENYENRMKYKLWEDLAKDVTQRRCPFCGEQISAERLFSGEFEIEHLLPFSMSFLDARSNKVISCRRCNREKGNLSPFEAFANDAKKWNEILARVELLPENKKWKFDENAFDRLKKDGGDVLARMLTDTQYMSRMARLYLCCAAHPSKVSGIPGQLTAKLRNHWGLNAVLSDENEKDRADHRHHAIDAFVVACTGRGTLQKYATERRDYYQPEMPSEKAPHLPYPSFRHEEIQKAFDSIVISHKPDHGNPQKAIQEGKTVAKLHEETYYGMAGEGEKKGTWKLIQRVPVTELEKADDLDVLIDQKGTADPIRVLLEGHDSSEHKGIIADYFKKRGTLKVRTYRERNKDVIVPFKDKSGREYRYAVYGGNAYAEIYCPDRGKNAGKWQVEIIPNFCAHQKGFIPEWRHNHAHAKLIMRLHIDDMVAYEKDGKTILARVKKMTGGNVYLRENKIAKEETDKLSWGASGEQLHLRNARKIKVDILGRVTDPKKPKPEPVNG